MRILKNIIFLLLIKVRKQLFANFGPNRDYLTVSMEPNVNFWVKLGQHLTFDLSCRGQFCEF